MMDKAHFHLGFLFVHQFVSVRNNSGRQSSVLLNQEIVTAQIQNTSLYGGEADLLSLILRVSDLSKLLTLSTVLKLIISSTIYAPDINGLFIY